MKLWLHMELAAPLVSFGGESIDAQRVTREFPSLSMFTGLIANALGWSRQMREEHQALQNRIVFGVARKCLTPSDRMMDYQTAKLEKGEKVWSTTGVPIGRAGGLASYVGSYQQWKEYLSDIEHSVVLRLDPQDKQPNLEEVAKAIQKPARPLFIGRKSCLPSRPLYEGIVKSPSAFLALQSILSEEKQDFRVIWSGREGSEGSYTKFDISDERNWRTGLHGGSRIVYEGRIEGTKPE